MKLEQSAIKNLARCSRSVPYFPGRDRILRVIHNPDGRQKDSIKSLIPYHDGFILVDTASFVEWSVFFYGYYEARVTRLLQSIVHSDSVCIDVGANVGTHTLVMARAATQGTVYAFEPNPETYERLCANVALNNLRNVKTFELAISNTDGLGILYVPERADPNKAKASMKHHPGRGLLSTVFIKESKVQSIKELKALKRLDVIKIDVEGLELIVLDQFMKLIHTFRPLIIFECDPILSDVAKCLSSLKGYEFFSIENMAPLLGPPVSFQNVLAVPEKEKHG